MEKAIFRGKVLGKNEWAYGSLLDYKGCQIFDEAFDCFVDVDEKTIGQYSGITDTDGTKIFEGDILQKVTEPHISKPAKFLVMFHMGAFGTVPNTGNFVSFADTLFAEKPEVLKVVGNIHDDPEFLQKKRT